METIKRLDIFGSGIKWRLFREDTFRSIFGSGVTSLLFVLFCVKLTSFYQKFNDYGFTKYKKINQIQRGNDLLFNLTQFEFKIKFENYQLVYKTNDFKLEDYMKIEFIFLDYPNDAVYLKNLQKVDCPKYLNNETNLEIAETCYKLHEDIINLNITKNFFFEKVSGKYLDQIELFRINFKWTKKFEEIYDELSRPLIQFIYKYYTIDMRNFTFIEYDKTIDISLDKLIESKTFINLNKIYLEEKFDFDFLDFNVREVESYNFDPNSITRFTRRREKPNMDSLVVLLYNNLEKHEIISLSLDDILSVIGGYIQITFSIAQFFLGFYNDKVGNGILNDFCFEKINNYEKRLSDLKKNMDYQRKIIFKENVDKMKKNCNGDYFIKYLPSREREESSKNEKQNEKNLNNEINENFGMIKIKDSIRKNTFKSNYPVEDELQNSDKRKINDFSIKTLREKISLDEKEELKSDLPQIQKASCEMSEIRVKNNKDNSNIDLLDNNEKKNIPNQIRKS